ncbi:MAG: CapA family protein [Dehalococcoidia bacterium]
MTASLAYLQSTRDVEVKAANPDPGIALTAVPEPVSYSLQIPAAFEGYRIVAERFAATSDPELIPTSQPGDLSLTWVASGASPQYEFGAEQLVISVPFTTPVFNLTAADFERVLRGEVSNWSEVGGGDYAIALDLAAGESAGGLGFPTEVVESGSTDAARFEIYEGLSTSRRALRVDGTAPGRPEYPYNVSRALVVNNAEAAPLAVGLVEALRVATEPEPSVTIAAVGDLMLANVVATNMQNLGVDQPFELVSPYLQQADITFGNLEGTLTDRGVARPKNYRFRTPPSLAGGLLNAGFDIISVANNHTMDYGPDGLTDTLGTLDYLGIPRVGAGLNEAEARAPVILEVNGLRIGFLAYVNVGQEVKSDYVNEIAAAGENSPGVAWARPENVSADVAALNPQVDLVVVSMHIGIENSFSIREWQTETAFAAIDAGAELVLGHHAHVLQRLETYGEGVIIWGLGNFIFDLSRPGNKTLTAIAYFELTRDGVTGYDFLPAEINVVEHRPRPILDASGLRLVTHLLGFTELPREEEPLDSSVDVNSETPTVEPTATATP